MNKPPSPLTEIEEDLFELLNAPQPPANLSARLRRELAAQAEAQAASRRPGARLTIFWQRLTRAGQFGLGLAGAALLLALVVLGGTLLPPHAAAPQPVRTPITTTQTPQPAASPTRPAPTAAPTSASTAPGQPTASPLQIPTLANRRPPAPQITLDSCPLPVKSASYTLGTSYWSGPTALAGGGQLKTGPFTLEIWLFCDPTYRRSDPQHYSEIDGLGISTRWVYTGPKLDGTARYASGIEPYGQQYGDSILMTNISSDYVSGVTFPPDILPDFSAPKTPLRFLLKIQLPSGAVYGAGLSFTLQREGSSYQVVDAALKPLAGADLQELSIRPAGTARGLPTLDPLAVYPELKPVYAALDGWQKSLTGEAAWLHQISTLENREPFQAPASRKNSTTDEWTQLDVKGQVIRKISVEKASDGTTASLSMIKGGQCLYLVPDIQHFDCPPYAFEPGRDVLRQILSQAQHAQLNPPQEATVEGRPAWSVLLEGRLGQIDPKDQRALNGQRVIGYADQLDIDRLTGELIARTSYTVLQDGTKVLSTRIVYQSYVRVTTPPEEIKALLNMK